MGAEAPGLATSPAFPASQSYNKHSKSRRIPGRLQRVVGRQLGWTGGYLRTEDGFESANFPSSKRFELRDHHILSSLRRGLEVRDWDSAQSSIAEIHYQAAEQRRTHTLVEQPIKKSKKLEPLLLASSLMRECHFANKKQYEKCSNHGRCINKEGIILMPDNSQKTYDEG